MNDLLKNFNTNTANSTTSTIGMNPTPLQTNVPMMTPQTSTVDIPKTIPSDTLAYKAPQNTMIEAPINAPSQNLDALSGAIMTAQQAPVVQPTERDLALKDRQSAIEQYLNPESGYSATSSRLQQESGLIDKTTALNALGVKDIALQKQMKDYEDSILNKNTQGLFGGAGQQAISQYQRDISSQRADLAIQKLALQGDIKGATDLINLKLDAQFKPIADRIDYLDKTLSIYNNDLTEKQKSQLEMEKYQLQTQIKDKADFQSIIDEAGVKGASVDVQNNATKLFAQGDRAGAIALLAPYSKKAEDMYGGYDGTQNKVISSTNDKIAKSTTYQKAVNVSGYVDSALANLKNNTGASDIAAINQFQKVVDEGAVTRDQDVALLQSSQSLLNSLQTKVNKLAKGQQLSPQLRDEMRQAMNSMKDAAIGAVNDDPYIKAQTSQLQRYGIDPNDTIIGEISQKYNPDVEMKELNGVKYKKVPGGWEQVSFNSVGSDTKQATGVTRAQKNNNPLNIKVSSFTSKFDGVAGTDPKPASDGGNFLTFNSPQAGFDAGVKLLKTPGYLNLDLEKAMRRWSGGASGYGADVAPQFAGRKIRDLSDSELQTLIQLMATREGYYNKRA